MNTQLYVAMEDSQAIIVKQKGWKYEDGYDRNYDDDRSYDFNFRLKFKDGILVSCVGEDDDVDDITMALENGVDFQKGAFRTVKPVLYDLPEWNITGYTVGEIMLEVYRRVTAKFWVKDWPEYTKYLTNGDANFKAEKP